MADQTLVKCSKCGEPHERCTAHNRAGKPCRLHPMLGQRVCKFHGGAAPAARAKGRQRAELAKATADYHAKLGHAPGEGITDPLSVLAELAAEALAMKDALAKRVNALHDIRYEDTKGSEQLRSEVVLYERALDRAAKFVDLMARSGFEDARVKMEQAQGMLVYQVLKRILDQLELNEHQRTIAGEVVPMELRRLEGQGDSR